MGYLKKALLYSVLSALIVSPIYSLHNKYKTINLYKGKNAVEIQRITDSPKKAYDYLKRVYGSQSFCVDVARLGCYLVFDDDYLSMPLLFDRDNERHCICVFRDKDSGNYGFFDNGNWGYEKAKFDSVLAVSDYINIKKGFNVVPFSKNSLIKNEDYSSKEGLESLIKTLDRDKRETELLNKRK